jgi:serine/threonine protein kinase/Tol biopolymer transport system component
LIGTRTGPYEVIALLGAGGMGEVYRARDTRLERDVALKVLPEEFFEDPERKARFEREARLLAGLSHPNIAVVYAFEEIPGSSGSPQRHLLAMELLEGETLRAAVSRGSLPVRKALDIAAQVASGLAAAHGKGIVHRDVKPENVFLTTEGHVKLLDFGLARHDVSRHDPTDTRSPTLAAMSQQGVVQGTVAYMSPEQARGEAVFYRSDQFSLGVVLYELLTGKRPFERSSAAETMAAIIREEPEPVTKIEPRIPAPVAWLVQRCLSKDPADRYASTQDLAKEVQGLRDHLSEAVSATEARPAAVPWIRRRIPLWGAAGLAALVALLILPAVLRPRPRSLPTLRASLDVPADDQFGLALSPDGRQLAYVAWGRERKLVICIRTLGEETSRELPGTENCGGPFWSPDSRSLGFYCADDKKLKRVDLAGGPSQALCDMQNFRGASWGSGGVIVFSPGSFTPIFKVPETGGKPEAVTRLDSAPGATHRWPHFLPDGNHFVYLATSGAAAAEDKSTGIYAGSIDGSPPRLLVQARSSPAYASGRLLYVTAGRALVAQPFDTRRLTITGPATPVAENAMIYPGVWWAPFSASPEGLLVFSKWVGEMAELKWLDRSGRVLSTVGPPAIYDHIRLSSNGRRVAASVTDPKTGTEDVWTYDSERGAGTRVTFDPAADGMPVWTAGDGELVFHSYRNGMADLYIVDPARPGSERLLNSSKMEKRALDVSPDGRTLLYGERGEGEKISWDLRAFSLPGSPRAELFLKTGFQTYGARFSPDGRWVAYDSDESGSSEVYVRPFPGPGGIVRISTSGGRHPVWSRDGKELFFFARGGKLTSVPVKSSPRFEAGNPVPLFQLPGGDFDVSPDGKRFLAVAPVSKEKPLSLILNWTARLTR